MRRSDRIQLFCEEIWRWYGKNKRTLPWRDLKIEDGTQRAYEIFVSEIMLQQTQVPRVEVLFPRFLKAFPTLQDLAAATNQEVIIAWRGLGYNSRALRLRDAARTIANRHDVIFPQAMDDLLAIKGIGDYTAAAIRNFAFNMPTPCVDVNIERILLRVFYPSAVLKMPKQELIDLAGAILMKALDPRQGRDAKEWHSALMDFGSLVDRKKAPCPLIQKHISMSGYKDFLSKKPKREPSRGKIPNRIFRGRIVEKLRDASGYLHAEDIGPLICEDWGKPQDKKWLNTILSALERDGLVQIRTERVALKQ